MLSLSTSWLDSGEDIKEWLPRVKALGVDAIELSYKITADQLRDAEGLLGPLGLRVSSIHNFCPMPDDEPVNRHPSNYYRLSALDEHERRQAVNWTKVAVDTAVRVGAGVVVIHAGTLDFEDERSPRLFDLYTAGKQDSFEFRQERDRVLRLRDEKKKPYLESLSRSLDEVVAHSIKENIVIGLETRYYPVEIPNFEEIGYFLSRFDKRAMGYWHDVGHAEINSRLGIKPHREFLQAYKDRLIGVHLHGIRGRRDHLAPFDGDMDLVQYLPFFGKGILKVIESKPFASAELIKAAVCSLRGAQ